MKPLSRWMIVAVLVVNAVVATFLIGGATATPAHAEVQAEPVAAADDANDPTREALSLLGRELAERAEQLARREAEFEEYRRGEEVRLRAGLTPPPVAAAAAAQPQAEPAPPAEPDAEQQAADEAFARLSKAYENMEPDSAALALKELAEMDRDAVVQLLAGWPPRTSGAILDSLTQLHPALAARLSYEIWKRSGKTAPPAAGDGR